MNLDFGAHELERALLTCETKRELQRLLCVWLKVSLSLTSKQIALAIGWTPAAVRRLQSSAARQGIDFYRDHPKGGRRHAYIPLSREKQIMVQFARRARRGQSLDVGGLRRVYELSVGKRVSLSTIYRLIERHGLRRFLPAARKTRNTDARDDRKN